MVAIVSGDSLGLSLSSLATLGQQGGVGSSAAGRNGQGAFVNAATGNVILQTLDDRFDARGADLSALRTYNSQGKLMNGVQDAWAVGSMRQRLILPVNGSPMVRVDRDGAESSYTGTSPDYKTTAGAGADDTIKWDGATGQYTYTEGTSGLMECFDSTGRLVKSIDELNLRYGRDVIRFAALNDSGGWQSTSTHRDNDANHPIGRDMLGLGKTFSKSVRFL